MAETEDAIQELFSLLYATSLSEQSRKDTQLLLAAKTRDLDEIKRLLDAKANINAHNSHGETALCTAALQGYEDALSFLLSRRAEISYYNTSEREMCSSLLAAAKFNRVGCIKLLIDHKADPDHRSTRRGDTALIWAAYFGNLEAAQMLVNRGADKSIVGERGQTAAQWAREMKHQAVADFLDGITTNTTTTATTTTTTSTSTTSTSTTSTSTTSTSTTSISTTSNSTTSNSTTSNSTTSNSTTSTSTTTTASMSGTASMNLLTEPIPSPSLNQQLIEAAKAGKVTRVAQLLDAKADIDCATPIGDTPLLTAAAAERANVVAYLLDRKASLFYTNVTEDEIASCLLPAAKFNSVDSIRVMIEHKADVNHQSQRRKDTALIWGAYFGRLPAVKLLIEAKADPTLQGEAGRTAIEWGRLKGHSNVVNFLSTCPKPPGKAALAAAAAAARRAAAAGMDPIPSTPGLESHDVVVFSAIGSEGKPPPDE